jgi:hypothetical protein
MEQPNYTMIFVPFQDSTGATPSALADSCAEQLRIVYDVFFGGPGAAIAAPIRRDTKHLFRAPNGGGQSGRQVGLSARLTAAVKAHRSQTVDSASTYIGTVSDPFGNRYDVPCNATAAVIESGLRRIRRPPRASPEARRRRWSSGGG